MTMPTADTAARDEERKPLQHATETDLEALYKKVGITAVFAAANYVKQAKPRRAA